MLLEDQISILEWFLKDHVTLKTGVMMLKIQLRNHRNKVHFKISLSIHIYLSIYLSIINRTKIKLSIHMKHWCEAIDNLMYMCLHCFSTWCISALDVNSQYHVFPQYWNCLSNTVRSLRRSALLRADWWTGSSKNENVKLREKLRFVTCLRGGKRGGLGGCLGGSGLRFTLALWPFSGSVFVIWGGGGGGGGSGAVIGFEWARGRGENWRGKTGKGGLRVGGAFPGCHAVRGHRWDGRMAAFPRFGLRSGKRGPR